MKKIPFASHLLLRWFPVLALWIALGAGQARAVGDTNLVVYSPSSQGVYGTLPASISYPLTITCPLDVQASDLPLTVTLKLTPTTWMVGDQALAATYVAFSSPTVTFKNAGDTATVQVTVSIPSTALTAAVPAGAYTYDITTTGWPAGIIDDVSQINASVYLPGTDHGNPPVVTIGSPGNYETFTYAAGNFPQTIPFTFTATADSISPVITAVGADFGTPPSMLAQVVTADGIGTNSVTASGSFVVDGPGTYKLHAWATNSKGTGSDEHTVTVTVTVPPPTATIASPADGAQFVYRAGDPLLQVPFTFFGNTTYGGIKDLTAMVDNNPVQFTAAGLNGLSATATVYLSYGVEGQGTHSLSVTATDAYGQTASATGNFTINYVAPQAHVVIDAPLAGQIFQVATGQTTAVVPYSFTTTVTNGFGVDSVSATINGTPLSPSTIGFTQPSATSTGTMNLAPGTYELVATGGSVNIFDTAKVTFTVKSAALPPTVTIDSPVNGYVKEIVPGTTATIPFQFTGKSVNPGSTITAMTAQLDGAPLAFSCTTIGSPTAVGTATLTFNSAGTHSLKVTATDANGTATALGSFTISLMAAHSVSGVVFFDVNSSGTRDAVDYGLAGVCVKLSNSSGATIGTATTNASGSYSFPGLYPGTYTVTASAFAGLRATTPTTRSVTLGSTDVTPPAIGFGLNFCAIQGMKATGYTIGYWKNNIDKAIAKKTSGVQVNAATIATYTNNLAAFALTQFDGLTNKQASAIMGSSSSKPADLLAKQLLASEYNYQNGAFLNGNATLTYAFVYWGEWVLSNSSNLSSCYVIWAKDWFDAYNNTHGGAIAGP